MTEKLELPGVYYIVRDDRGDLYGGIVNSRAAAEGLAKNLNAHWREGRVFEACIATCLVATCASISSS